MSSTGVSMRMWCGAGSPERVGKLLLGLMERQTAKNEDYSVRLTGLRAKLTDAEGRLGRLYAAIESGIADPSDATLKERVAAVKTERDIAQVAFDRAVAELRPNARITEEKIAAFTETMRPRCSAGNAIQAGLYPRRYRSSRS